MPVKPKKTLPESANQVIPSAEKTTAEEKTKPVIASNEDTTAVSAENVQSTPEPLTKAKRGNSSVSKNKKAKAPTEKTESAPQESAEKIAVEEVTEITVAPKKKILFVASEATPFIATGGLAEVIGSLSIRIFPGITEINLSISGIFSCLSPGVINIAVSSVMK